MNENVNLEEHVEHVLKQLNDAVTAIQDKRPVGISMITIIENQSNSASVNANAFAQSPELAQHMITCLKQMVTDLEAETTPRHLNS